MRFAVAWDIDGTIVDSEWLHHQALQLVSAANGVEIANADERFLGVAMDDVWQALRPLYPEGLTYSDWQSAITSIYLKRVKTLVALPDVLDAMKALMAAGITQCCVSNSRREIALANLSAVNALPFIAFSVCRDDVTNGKPHPEPYLTAKAHLNDPGRRWVVFEDSETGMQSAVDADCEAHLIHPGTGQLPQVIQTILDRNRL